MDFQRTSEARLISLSELKLEYMKEYRNAYGERMTEAQEQRLDIRVSVEESMTVGNSSSNTANLVGLPTQSVQRENREAR